MVQSVCRDNMSLLEQGTATFGGLVEPFRLANGNLHYELGQVYESIRVQLRAMPSIPFLKQQDLQHFVAPPDEYIPELHANLTIEEIAAAYAPLVALTPTSTSHCAPTDNSAILDGSEPRPFITRTELNQSLKDLQLYIIQTAPETAIRQDAASLMDSITTWRTGCGS